MNKTFSIVILLICFCALANVGAAQTFYGTTDLKIFRDGRDQEFRKWGESPLLAEDFVKFAGLNYFETNEKLRVTATLTKTPDEKYFWMPTSSGNSTEYVKYGVLKFKLDGKEYSLNAYKWKLPEGEKYQQYKDSLLVPFKDATNRAETYGGGRYLYLTTPKEKTAVLDFNLAFNPSCAYGNKNYSCPIPPSENHLKIKIEAGEKSYLPEKQSTPKK